MNNIANKADCRHCRLSDICLPSHLANEEIDQLENIIFCKRPLKTGECLFHQADPGNSLYVVKSGTFRAAMVDEDGATQAVNFYFPGEIMGLDSLENGRYHSSVTALETATVCELRHDRLNYLCAKIPSLQMKYLRVIGAQIAAQQDRIALLAMQSAAAKLAAFLLMLSKRYAALGYSKAEFNLTMERCDIASFLNMAIETLSRQLAVLKEKGIISVKNRNIHINDLELLKTVE